MLATGEKLATGGDFMITSIAHSAVKVTNMEATLNFYCNQIGFTKAFELADDQGQPWIVYLKICKGFFIELFYDGVKDRDKAYAADVTGYHHWCVSVGDIDRMAQKLFVAGLIPEAKAKQGRDGNRNLWIHDPDGNAVEFVQYSPDSPHMKSNSAACDFTQTGFTGIGHVAYVVSDMVKSMDFFSSKLGFKLIYELADEQGRPWLNYLRVKDGSYIELFYGGTRTVRLQHESAGFMHLCLECDDVYATVEFLRAKGIEIDVEAKQGKDKNYQAWIHDPDGNKIELMSIDPDSLQAKA